MLKYFRFFIYCALYKRSFFKLPLHRQAHILKKYRLYKLSGILYKRLGEYQLATYCFEKVKAYKHLLYTYYKLGYPSKSIEIALNHGYYREGAAMCKAIGNLPKAAQFLAFYDPKEAGKLYKKLGLFYEAGLSFISAGEFIRAIDCFYLCKDIHKRTNGLKRIEEIAIVLFFQKNYNDAFKLFIKLQDIESAKICAQKKGDSLDVIFPKTPKAYQHSPSCASF